MGATDKRQSEGRKAFIEAIVPMPPPGATLRASPLIHVGRPLGAAADFSAAGLVLMRRQD
jgi:hypothetical protein